MATAAVARTRECTKFRHPSERHALQALYQIWGQRRGPRRLPTRAYLCPLCGSWHLTSQPARKRFDNPGGPVAARVAGKAPWNGSAKRLYDPTHAMRTTRPSKANDGQGA